MFPVDPEESPEPRTSIGEGRRAFKTYPDPKLDGWPDNRLFARRLAHWLPLHRDASLWSERTLMEASIGAGCPYAGSITSHATVDVSVRFALVIVNDVPAPVHRVT